LALVILSCLANVFAESEKLRGIQI
jgi:hypothetical protein